MLFPLRAAFVAFPLSFLLAVGTAWTEGPSDPSEAPVIVIDTDARIERVNRNLLGVAWNSGDIERLAPLRPDWVRIDAFLGQRSPAPGELDMDPLLDSVARVHAAGGEPLVILSYMPEWLGAPRAEGCTVPLFGSACSPNRVAPDDLDAWERLIEDVVRILATANPPARRFEVWNEPDLPVFWHDSSEAFLEMALRTHRAVERVAREIGLDLEVGGPAVSLGIGLLPEGPPFVSLAQYVEAVRDAGLPLDFVSWHWYANLPNLGPDGAEFSDLPGSLYDLLAGINPLTTPTTYGKQIRAHRELLDTLLGGTGLAPELVIDEWNLSGGGFDLRHGTNEGTAFVAGSLIEMEKAGLDRGLYYNAVGGFSPGDWGLATQDGARRPTWYLLRAWQKMRGWRLALTGDDPAGGLFARAVRRGRRVDILLSTFRAVDPSAREVKIELSGQCRAGWAVVRHVDADSRDFRARELRRIERGRFALSMSDQSVTWATLRCKRPRFWGWGSK